MAKNNELGKRLCRVVTYFSSLVLAISGLVFFIIGCYFVAVFSGVIKSLDVMTNTTIVGGGEERDLAHMPPYLAIPIVSANRIFHEKAPLVLMDTYCGVAACRR